MEPLESETGVMDDFLLNFSEDLFYDHDSSSSSLHQHHQQQPQKTQAGPAQQSQQPQPQPVEQQGKNGLLAPDLDPFLTSFPAVEGELDWMTSRGAFPTSFFIPVPVASSASRPPKKQAADGWGSGGGGSGSGDPKRPSPVSVLEAAGGTWPVRKRSKARRRLRAVLPVFRVDQQPRPAEGGAPRRRCWHCRADETPQWRAGPAGPKTLCNACGVRYKSGRLVPEYRPASSPTFSSELHSNSHRKIVEMRRRKAMGSSPDPSSPLGPAAALAAPPALAKARKKKRRKKKEDSNSNSNSNSREVVVSSFV